MTTTSTTDTAGPEQRHGERHEPGPLGRLLLFTATVAMGLIAGFFYAYACSVMLGLARTDDRTFVATMQAINATVRNAAFAPSFFGALLLTAGATFVSSRRRARALVPWLAAALVLYAIAFVVTMAVSVPLNRELADAGPPDAIGDLAGVRAAYEGPWVRWNIARTLAATAALACLVRATLLHREPPTREPRRLGTR